MRHMPAPARRKRRPAVAAMVTLVALASAVPLQSKGVGDPATRSTVSAIPLDALWKQRLYAFARDKLLHPAWGWSHSERNYILAQRIAAEEGLSVDPDILFAASFVHDIGAIGDFQKEGVDHAVRSVELAEPLLRDAGFPQEKLAAVGEAVLGHMHDKVSGRRNESIVLHDADTLDFLGTVGVARRLSVTGSAPTYSGGVERIREFADKLPQRLVTRSGRRMAVARVAEMREFLDQLEAETLGGRLP